MTIFLKGRVIKVNFIQWKIKLVELKGSSSQPSSSQQIVNNWKKKRSNPWSEGNRILPFRVSGVFTSFHVKLASLLQLQLFLFVVVSQFFRYKGAILITSGRHINKNKRNQASCPVALPLHQLHMEQITLQSGQITSHSARFSIHCFLHSPFFQCFLNRLPGKLEVKVEDFTEIIYNIVKPQKLRLKNILRFLSFIASGKLR